MPSSLRLSLAKRTSKLPETEVRTIPVPGFYISPSLTYPKSILTGFNAPVLTPPDSITRATAVTLNLVLAVPRGLVQVVPVVLEHPQRMVSKNIPFQGEEVSGNLFDPLVHPGRTDGKHYGKRFSSAGQDSLFGPQALPGTENAFPKAYRERKVGRSFVRQGLSIWDLIFPLLMPRLNFEFGQIDLPKNPFPFQYPGIDFLLKHHSALLADEMGLGKTVMAVIALRILFQNGLIRKALIVCPRVALEVWSDHIWEWTPTLSLTVVRGTPQVRKVDWNYPAHVYLTTYDTVRSDVLDEGLLDEKALSSFDLVIIDEAQYIKNPGSGRSRAVKKLKPSVRWALTGTPVENSVDDIVSIMNFVKPGLMTAKNLAVHNVKSLVEPYFLRRHKKDVFEDLPPKTVQDVWLDLDEDQKREYEAAESSGKSDLDDLGEKLTHTHIFALITKLKQICNFASGSDTSPKVDTLKEILDSVVESGGKALVFSQYLEQGINKMEPHLKEYGYVTYTGQTSDGARRDAVGTFRRDGEVKVFLGSVRASGLSLTLTEASYVVHFDHWWNPAVAWQAEDRAHRYGQTLPVMVYRLWMHDTIEGRIFYKLKEKGLLFEELVEGLSEKAVDEMFSLDDWREILGLKRKAPEPKLEERGPIRSIDEVLEVLMAMPPEGFEKLVRNLFLKIGYASARVTQRSHDGGVDVVGIKLVESGEERVVIQCKRRRDAVGVEVAHELLGVIKADPSITRGILVTTSRLSSECQAFVNANGCLSALPGPEVAKLILDVDLPL